MPVRPQAPVVDPAVAVERILDRRARRLPGVAVGVLRSGESWFAGRGRIGDERPEPRADTLFEIGSVTKVFTATVLADMVEDGTVELDEPVQHLLPDTVRLPVRGRPITLRDLSTHTSGLPRLPKGMLRRGLRERSNPYASFGLDDLERAIRETRLRRAPGRKVRYSNFGVGLLGHALALRSGTSYAELVRARICAPLDLSDTVVDVPAEAAGRLADGHDRRGRRVPHWDLPTLAGAGALRSTVADLLRFLALQLDPPPTPLGRAATRTHERLAGRGPMGQCLGWMISPDRDPRDRVHWHNGGTGGFRSFAGFSAPRQTAVVVLANGARSVDRIGFTLLRELGGRT